MHWLQIACERERAANGARARTMASSAAGEDYVDALTMEMQASMVAISGAAHAIDALYGEISPLVPIPPATKAAWEANDTKRPSRIFETLKLGCTLGRCTNERPKQFRALYELRDPAVHHQIKHLPTVPHMSGIANVSNEGAEYCVENLRTSLDLAYDVVLTALTNPRVPDLVAWAGRMEHVSVAIRPWRTDGHPSRSTRSPRPVFSS